MFLYTYQPMLMIMCKSNKLWFCMSIPILEVSINGGTPKSSILMGCSLTKTIQLLRYPYFRKPPFDFSSHIYHFVRSPADLPIVLRHLVLADQCLRCRARHWRKGPNHDDFSPGKKVETQDFTEQLVFFFFLFIDLGLCNDGEVASYCLPNVTLVDARYL